MPAPRIPQDGGYGDRRKDRDDRRRSQAQGNIVVPPSPALIRNGSKQRKIPSVLSPGQLTPHPAQAYIPIAVNRANGQHPYAVAGIGAGYEYAQQNEQYKSQQNYDRISPMVPSVGVAPVAVSNIRAMGGETGVSQDYIGQDLGEDPTKPSFFKILTCRC